MGPSVAVSGMQNDDSDTKLAQESEGVVDGIDGDGKQTRGTQASKRDLATVSPLWFDPEKRRVDHCLALPGAGFLDSNTLRAFSVLIDTCSK